MKLKNNWPKVVTHDLRPFLLLHCFKRVQRRRRISSWKPTRSEISLTFSSFFAGRPAKLVANLQSPLARTLFLATPAWVRHSHPHLRAAVRRQWASVLRRAGDPSHQVDGGREALLSKHLEYEGNVRWRRLHRGHAHMFRLRDRRWRRLLPSGRNVGNRALLPATT